jgi:CRP/FNR family transcriptional regulator, cyclic AMP receptor protein
MSVRCRAQVHTATISYEQFKELYFQNPQFGFALLRLIVARLHGNAEVGRQAEVS